MSVRTQLVPGEERDDPSDCRADVKRSRDRGPHVRIGLFATCVADTMFPEAARATVTVLEGLGHEVVVPGEQTCCGQMHMNSGIGARRFRWPSGSGDLWRVRCGGLAVVVVRGAVRELYGSCWGSITRCWSGRWSSQSFSCIGSALRMWAPPIPHRVTYHPTCHSLRVTRIGDAPLRLLRNVKGLELLELPDATECCGFGGTFSIKNAETSSAILADKCSSIESTGADVCTAVDGSCLLQIGGGLSRRGDRVQAVHLAEILASR